MIAIPKFIFVVKLSTYMNRADNAYMLIIAYLLSALLLAAC